jgi:hypothetical protein
LQGEGQEFESPRLHHLVRRPGTPRRTRRSPDPWPPLEGTDQRTAGEGFRPRWLARERGRTLPTGYVIGKREVFLIFDFAVLSEQFRLPIRQPVTAWSEAGGSSYTGHEVDALAPRADEGRGRLRKAPGSREQTSIRRCPNGETRLEKSSSPLVEPNRPGGGKPAN